MTQSFSIPWDFEAQPAITFDGHCVCCGERTAEVFHLRISADSSGSSRHARHTAMISMPLCARCARNDERNGLLTYGTFLGVGVLSGIAIFALTFSSSAFFSDVLGADRFFSVKYGWLVATACALVGGLIVGTVAEAIARLFVSPFLGAAFRFEPLIGVQLLSPMYFKAGVSYGLSSTGDTLHLKFANDAAAAAFSRANTPDG